MHLQVSGHTAQYLKAVEDFDLYSRGVIDVKGKGGMET